LPKAPPTRADQHQAGQQEERDEADASLRDQIALGHMVGEVEHRFQADEEIRAVEQQQTKADQAG